MSVLVLPAKAADLSGEVGIEFRTFPQSPIDTRQHSENVSGYIQPEFYEKWDGESQSVTFEPFFRWDQHDDERTHFDLREFFWEKASRNWEIRAGLKKVFWGVTESQHLVDIINQTDAVENIDGEDKLGQPMINAAWIDNWGTVDFYLMPWFRERTFPGDEGRMRSIPPVDTDNAQYESGAEDRRLDWATRWSHYFGDYDFGISHFSGTSRDPRLIPDVTSSGEVRLLPFYDVIGQTSFDFQATKGGMLWKFEGLTRTGQGDRFYAMAGGFEYTLVGILESLMDLGVLLEYHRDDRNSGAPTPFQNDVFIGTRLTPNDAQSTEFLVGGVFDVKDDSYSAFLEASRRLAGNIKASIEGRTFSSDSSSNSLYSLRRDDHLQFDLIYYY